MIRSTAMVLLILGWAVTVAEAQAQQKPENPAFAQVKDDPKLPCVLLIGDSISIGYTVPVRKLLEGKANVHRIPVNGGPSSLGADKMKTWLGEGKWDVIHFNFGLHDIKLDTNEKHQVSAEDYEKNMRRIVQVLQETKAVLIWCSTTPVPDGKLNPPRKKDDVVKYNNIAKKIAEENKIAVNDLYSFALPKLDNIQRPANVHFTDAGSEELAKAVAESIQKALKR